MTETPDDEDEQTDGSGYVHRPSGEPPRKLETDEQSFGWRGWVLVAVLVLSFLIIPWTLIGFSTVQGSVAALGLPWRDTFLVVPMIPAVLLGLVGVWTALRARGS